VIFDAVVAISRRSSAVNWICAALRANYSKTLRVEVLAQLVGMGVCTLHHHFRVLTSMSPLQYQKTASLARGAAADADGWSGRGERGF